jgi:hypothetical protein
MRAQRFNLGFGACDIACAQEKKKCPCALPKTMNHRTVVWISLEPHIKIKHDLAGGAPRK